MLAFTRTMLLWFSFDTSNSRGILKNIACVLSRMVVLRCVLSGMDKMVKNIIQPTNIIAATPGFSACLFGLQKIQPKESHLGNKTRYLLGLITCECRRMWDTWVTLADNSQFKTYMGVSVLFLSSLYSHRTPRWFWASAWPLWRPLLCSSLCGKTRNMARSASRVLACVLLALACSAMLCFVGTTPSPAAGSTPLKQSLRAPAVQMEARGGGEGALGDMSPDTYIIGITVLGIASLFANISGFFNPWEDMRRPESGSGHDIEVFSILTSEGSICCPWQSRSPCDLGRHSIFEGTNGDRQWAFFSCWHGLLAVGPGFSACLFGLQKLQPKESHLGKKRRYLLGLITCEHRRMWDTWVTLADNSQFKTYMGVSVLFLSSLYSHRTPRWFWLQLDLFEGRSCAALCVAKLATWLAPPHVCSLACSWPLPARRCFALWAPLPVLLQEAPRWSSLCGHRPCRWRREAAVRVPLATWVPTLTSLASPCLGLHPCLPTSAASSTHEKTWEDQRVAAAMI